MISTQRIVHCTNPDCTEPINPVGNDLCAGCQTPLTHRYLWARSDANANRRFGDKVADRYQVQTPQIWLDTQPGLLPFIPEELSTEILNYLRLYPQRLHLPQVYGLANDVLLLENVPIDETGNLYPAMIDAWKQATAVRQVYWLWQILQLWTPLSELGVASSLLVPNNLRVQGWCVRLIELEQTPHDASLQELGQSWQMMVVEAKTPVAQGLEKIVQQMCSGEPLKAIATQLNELLLSTAAELPLILNVAGATDPGPEGMQNEDNCYPTDTENLDDPLLPQVSIVCDGIGGHEGGEVASQLAVQSLKLQIRALLSEVAEQPELVPMDLLQQQLEASVRVVNNVICTSNNEQKRESTQRMGTTLVMAVQVPQSFQTSSGWRSENAHELYLVNIGDSRAYWITCNDCQLLTVDDDVVAREVRSGRTLYRKALSKSDATALTQALGIRDGELLRLSIQRFIVEEDGVLLLCSDGLSDNNWVEQSWRNYGIPILTGELSLKEALHHWIILANQKNGHDNISVVLTHCRVSSNSLVPTTRALPLVVTEAPEVAHEEHTEFAETSQALLELDITEPTTPNTAQTSIKSQNRRKQWIKLGGLLALMVAGVSLGIFARGELNNSPEFQKMCRQLPQEIHQLCSSQR
ncbi:MAG: protein phosphatase 2C domain-containing protein [Rhizonema sp. PD38]|nr:protein phosphatase 2C domain-containing protein [Rhizonema sp. PD38]